MSPFRIEWLLFCACSLAAFGQNSFQSDTVKTSGGDLVITFIGHASLLMRYQKRIIHIDPVSREADYTKLPQADLILITHEHGDHFDTQAIGHLTKKNTMLLLPPSCQERGGGTAIRNGEKTEWEGISIEAVPAYNSVSKRPDGTPFHPKGRGNGYVLAFGDTRIYVAGDTEPIPEMKELKDIDIAFLPMLAPYTMSPEMAAEAAKMFRPAVVYPYHCGSTDTSLLESLLENEKDIEVRIRKM